MAVRAVTIDFWNTIAVARTNGEIRQRERLACLLETASPCRQDLADEHLRAAFTRAERHFNEIWERDSRTPGSDELLRLIWQELEVEIDDDSHRGAVTRFEEGLLSGPPSLTPGLKEALAWAAGHAPLAIISDTMFSPGRVIRQLLEREGVLQYFSAFVFSDETGFSKPDRRAFELAVSRLGVGASAAVHIGDLRRTDVAGANTAGLRSILYTGVHRDQLTGVEPHAELSHWKELPGLLERLG